VFFHIHSISANHKSSKLDKAYSVLIVFFSVLDMNWFESLSTKCNGELNLKRK